MINAISESIALGCFGLLVNRCALSRHRIFQPRWIDQAIRCLWIGFLIIGVGTNAADASYPSVLNNRAIQVKNFTTLCVFANRLSQFKYVPQPPLPPSLAELDYEQYRDIRFRHEKAVWADGEHPFWLEFYHRGFVQRDRVEIYTVAAPSKGELLAQADQTRTTRLVPYSPQMFQFDGNASGIKVDKDLGFAGFRIAGHFFPGGDAQELFSFVGSSYFRTRTAQTVYGLSARGIAIDVGMEKDEEFPDFRAFWIMEPQPGDESCTVLALLDGPSLTGAYEFKLHPGEYETRVSVNAKLYFRRAVEKLAIAPLTSMWMWGDGLDGPPLDQRPHVHDSDGLMVLGDGAWRWRPFARTQYPSISSISLNEIEGFGLLQRNRDVDDYQDSNAQYHNRPSVWVRPRQNWRQGRVELLELPGAHEGVDNIGAYFISDVAPRFDKPLDLRYDLLFFRTLDSVKKAFSVPPFPKWFVQSFKVSRGLDQTPANPTERRLVLTLNLSAREQSNSVSFGRDDQTQGSLNPDTNLVRAELIDQQIIKDGNGNLAVQIELRPTEELPVEVECRLKDPSGVVVSEFFRSMLPVDEPTFMYPAVYTRQE